MHIQKISDLIKSTFILFYFILLSQFCLSQMQSHFPHSAPYQGANLGDTRLKNPDLDTSESESRFSKKVHSITETESVFGESCLNPISPVT